MAKQIFVNLPVKDLTKSMDFFKGLGFSFNMQFTDQNAACLVLGENLYVMLLTEPFFKTFTNKEICDSSAYTEVLIAIDVDAREKVDEMVNKAVSSGGSIYREPQDYGWMYQNAFSDPDGHQWEVVFMDTSQIPANTGK
jgi:predicted lactoylglutathione lyase